MADKALGLLGLMRRAGAIEIGEDRAADAVRAGRAKLLLLSADLSEKAAGRAARLVEGRRVTALACHYSNEQLADALGVSGCAMAAVTQIGFADALLRSLAAETPERYGAAAAEMAGRCEKAARRKRETAARRAGKCNEKRRTEA